jgi:hypothetical protein
MGTGTEPSRSRKLQSPPERNGSARQTSQKLQKLRAAGRTVPILTWLNPSGVDAEAAATDQIDVDVGSVGELEALLKHAASRVRVI